jgi:hypothetical protein
MEKETIIIDFQVDNKDAIVSIESLTKANKELREERKKLDLQTEEGQSRVKEINNQLNRNTEIIKANSSALEKQKMNVGNYTNSIREAVPFLDKMTGGAASAAQGIMGMTKQALTFIATPIGAILAAVAAVLALVTAALKRSEPALDFFDDIIGSITEGARFLVDNLAAIASVIGNVLVGNFAEAAAGANSLADGFSAAQKEAQRLRKEFRELEDEEAKLIAATAGTEAQIKALIIQSKNRNLSEAERIKLLKEAEELERKSTEQKVNFENRKSAATIEQIGNERDLRRAQDETIDAYTQRLIASEKLEGKEKKAVAEAYAARVNASTATLALQEKIQNQQDAAFAKQEEEAKKRSEVARERELADSEFRISLLRQEVNRQKQLLDEFTVWANENSDNAIIRRRQKLLEETDAENQALVDRMIASQESLTEQYEQEGIIETEADTKRNLAALDRVKKQIEQEVFLKSFGEQQKLGIVSNSAAQFSKILGKQTQEGKALATVQALVDTYAGASAQLKLPFPYNLVAAATTIASGLANVAQIQGFKQGGYTGDMDTNQIAGVTHGKEFVMPASVVSQYGKEHFQSYMDGTIMANSVASSSGAQSQPPTVYLSYKEFSDFQNRVKYKEEMTAA